MLNFFSHTFKEVHEKNKFYLAYLQTSILEEYSVKSVFPVHFQLLVLPALLIHLLVWACMAFFRAKCEACDCTRRCNLGDDFDDGFDNKSDVDEEGEGEDDLINKDPMFVRGQYL
jgi:hypothetical protein